MSTVVDWMRALPARSVVTPAGTSALLPALIAGLNLLSVRSPLSAAWPVTLPFVPPTTPHADLAIWRKSLDTLAGVPHARLVPGHGPAENGARGIAQTRDWLDAIETLIRGAFEKGLDMAEAAALPLPAWAEKIALARYELERSVMHLYPKLEAREWPRVDRKA